MFAAVFATGNIGGHSAATIAHKMGIRPTSIVGYGGLEDKSIVDDNEHGHSLATLEEKMVAEHLPPPSQTGDSPAGGELQPLQKKVNNAFETSTPQEAANINGNPIQSHAEGEEHVGASSDPIISPENNDKSSHTHPRTSDADKKDHSIAGARSTLRKHVASKPGSKTWILPTPKPNVDPDGFEDPISDTFWKNVWVAVAVHNVWDSILI